MAEEESELRVQMRKKLEALQARGLDPYARYTWTRTHDTSAVKKDFAGAGAEKSESEVSMAGRIMALRLHGKAGFADLQDRDGRIQVYSRLDELGPEGWETFKALDRGDVVGIKGRAFRTKAGELTVAVNHLEVLSKALTPFPEKFHGLQDVQTRYRQRYLDLIMNEDVRQRFIKRARMVAFMRSWLNARGYLEVETPILQPLYGGALARPFKTHHNYLDMDLYLRIAPELYHKRCIVGDLDGVYEIGKNFRNEDIDAQHYPEYTSMELYKAYADYNDIMDLTESLLHETALHILGTDKAKYGDRTIDLAKPWSRVTMLDTIKQHTGVDFDALRDVEDARQAAVKLGVRGIEDCDTWGKIVSETFDQKAQPHLINPTFVIDHPIEVSPLSKAKRGRPELVERFELFINGWEFANAFSELNDPAEQERRFREQERHREAGDDEAHPIDLDYIRALEYGLPPTGGLGIGIDRYAMILTDASSIKEVLLFPHMKPEVG